MGTVKMSTNPAPNNIFALSLKAIPDLADFILCSQNGNYARQEQKLVPGKI